MLTSDGKNLRREHMQPVIYFRAKIIALPFGMSKKDIWWKEHDDLLPLLEHINRLSETIFLIGREDKVALELYQADGDSSLLVMNEKDSMFIGDNSDPHERAILYFSWTSKVGEKDRILEAIQEWDSEICKVITESQGIGSVSCDIHSDLYLGLEHACSTDEFDEADNISFQLVCR